MKVMCEHCQIAHSLNAAQMSVVIERMQKGHGHRFGRVPAHAYPKTVVNVVPVCLYKIAPILSRNGARR